METLMLTYVLAVAHVMLYGAALWITRYPVVTVFHTVIGTYFVAFGIRPILSAVHGGVTNLPVPLGWDAYNLGLLCQLVFSVAYICGYISLFCRRKSCVPDAARNTVTLRSVAASLAFGFLALLLIHVLSDGGWLPTQRAEAITKAVPMGKVLFPLAVIPFTVSLPLLYLAWLRHRGFPAWVFVGMLTAALLVLVLLYQRGFILAALLVGSWSYSRLVRKAGLATFVVMACFMFFASFLIRPLAEFIANPGGGVLLRRDILSEPTRYFLDSSSFSDSNVWPVVFAFLEQNDFTLGRTLAATPTRFLAVPVRRELGLLTAVDELNAFYWGDTYWQTGFGFNVTFPKELYISFGGMAMPLAALCGLVTALLDRSMWQTKQISGSTVYFATAAFLSWGFVGELGGTLQWTSAVAGIGLLARVAERVRLKRPLRVTPQRAV